MRRAHWCILLVGILLAAVGGCGSDSDGAATDDTPTTVGAVDSSTETTESPPTTDGPEVTSPEARVESLLRFTTGGRTLDVHIPEGPGPFPVVVMIHGVAMSRSGLAPLAEAVSDAGIVVFNADVRMNEPFDETIDDIACAVRYASAESPSYRGDPSDLTLFGFSGGAATGIVVALRGEDLGTDCLADGPISVDAFVAYEGPFDWSRTDYGRVDLTRFESSDPEIWEAVDPYTHIGDNPDLVVRLIHGDDLDTAWYEVPRAASMELHDVLLDAGYDVELTLLDNADHGAILRSYEEAFETAVAETVGVATG